MVKTKQKIPFQFYRNLSKFRSVVYLWQSFTTDELPWKSCGHSWNTPNCSSNSTNGTISMSPAEEFFNEYIVNVTPNGITDFGSIQWHVLLAHMFTWLAVFLCCFKGPISAGKVVYVTATMPYVLLTILLIRGLTLDGAIDGIILFLKPDFSKLAEITIWVEAAVQVIYQLGPCWGSLITMSRYNHFHDKTYRNAIILPIANLCTAIYGGLAIFSILGYMAKKNGVDITEVAKSGPAMAFVIYPEALAQLPFSQFFSATFFLVLITVGIDSQFAFLETVVSGIIDLFPQLRRFKILTAASIAGFLFILGIPLCTEAGVYIYQLLDWYGGTVTFVTNGFFESIAISYIYGLKRFRYDAYLMFGSPPNILVTICWFTATPIVTALMTFIGLSNWKVPIYDYTNYSYPQWAIVLGWLVGITSFLPTPIMFCFVIIRAKGNLWQVRFIL